MAKLEAWSDTWDEEHPIRWEPASGKEPDRYCTLAEAVRRLVGYGFDAKDARTRLSDGTTLRTAFALYSFRTR